MGGRTFCANIDREERFLAERALHLIDVVAVDLTGLDVSSARFGGVSELHGEI
jgi:hypothetical protein